MSKELEKLLFRYIEAVETGDLATLGDIWHRAETDSGLFQTLCEIDTELKDNMVINNYSKAQVAGSTGSRSLPNMRVAVILMILLGTLVLIFSLPTEDPANIVPIYGSTPTLEPPQDLQVITADNAAHIMQLGEYGEGVLRGALWRQDGILTYGTQLRFYDQNYELVTRIDLPFIADYAALTGDEETVVIADQNGQSAVIAPDGKITLLPPIDGEITDLDVYDSLIARVDHTNSIVYVWDLERNRERFVLRDIEMQANQVVFSKDGTKIAASGLDSSIVYGDRKPDHPIIQVWDTSSGENVHTFHAFQSESTYLDLQFGDSSDKLYAVSDNGLHRWTPPGEYPYYISATNNEIPLTRLLQADSSRVIALTQLGTQLYYYSPEFAATLQTVTKIKIPSPNASHILSEPQTMDLQGNQLLVARGQVVFVVDLERETVTATISDFAHAILRTDIRYPYVATYDGSTITVWDILTGKQVNSKVTSLTDFAFAPIEDTLAISGAGTWPGRSLTIWDFINDETSSIPAISQSRALVYSGPTLAAVTSFSTENLVVYDVETGELAAEIAYDKFDLNDETPVMSINELNHSVAVSSTSKQISVFDYENDSTRVDLDFHCDTVVGMAYNSDGTILASIDLSGNLILSDGIRETGYLKVGASARNVEFSPDDSLLAVASEKSIKLIDSRTLDVIKEFNAHSELIAGLGFTDDGSMLISSSHDGTIRLWGVPDA